MKLLITTALLITGFSLQASTVLFCHQDEFGSYDNTHIVLNDYLNLRCSSHRLEGFNEETQSGLGFDDDYYNVTIQGKGLGIRVTSIEGLMITCPTVRRKALGLEEFTNKRGKVKKGVTKLHGVKVAASALVGVDVGLFVNGKGGICLLKGITFGSIGLGISGAKMEVTRRNRY